MIVKQLISVLILLPLMNILGGQEVKGEHALLETSEIILTSAAGEKQAIGDNVSFQKGSAQGTVVSIHPEIVKQTIDGIGSSFTLLSWHTWTKISVWK